MKTIFGLLVATSVIVCCSNNNSTTDGGSDAALGDSGDPTKACSDEAAAVCALRDSCSPNYNNALVYGNTATCQTRVTTTCVNALAAKGTGNNAAHVEACAAAYPGENCADFFDNNPTAACVPPAGTLANGAACGASAQCTSTYCAIGEYAVCGTCANLPAVGDACQVQADCGRDLACATPAATGDGGAPGGKCAAWVAASGSCLTGYSPCQSGYSCVGDDEATMAHGTCQAAGSTVGAACDGSRKTMAGCDAEMGLACIPTAKGSAVGTCQNISLVGAGATCGDIGAAPITGVAACEASGLCKKAAPTDTSGTCVAAAADNAACDNDPSKGPPCLAPAKCVVTGNGTAGTCTVPNAATCM